MDKAIKKEGRTPSVKKTGAIRTKAGKGVKPVEAGTLTKEFLMGIKNGHFVVSNVGYSPRQPVFAEYVLPLRQRSSQWENIRTSGAQNRLCHVFKSKEDYDAYMAPILWDYVGKK
jgi:hypothetical protein